MKKLILVIVLFLGLAAVSLVSYQSTTALKADCCNEDSKCCVKSCCQ